MSAATARALSREDTPATSWELYKGWVYGLVIILAVLSVGAGFWFHFHP